MAITLPNTPPPQAVTPAYNSSRGIYRSPITAKAQVNTRLGDYFGIEVTLPPMEWNEAREWIALLSTGLGETVIYEWPQPFMDDLGTIGTPRVNGASQTGKTLTVDGFNTSYAPKRGQFFSLVTLSGLHELKMLTATPSLTGGAGTLAFTPALRESPGNDVVLAFDTPRIEGILSAPNIVWPVKARDKYRLSFSIEDAG